MNIKSLVRILIIVLIANIQTSYAQTVDLPLLNEMARDGQLSSSPDSLSSFCVRPIYYSPNHSALKKLFPDSKTLRATDSLQQSKQLLFLPLTLRQQYNTHHPYGWNDGSMIPSRGYQGQLSFGMYLKNGIISLQLQPEMVFAQNSSFQGFSSLQSDSIWRSYYNMVLNVTDAPERFGDRSYKKILPGQSFVRINYHKLSLGLSTENLWWGPGVRNSLLMSNNAPGFLHLSFNSSQPVTSSIGSFEWQVISGKLKGSGILPDDTTKTFDGQKLYMPKEKNDDRYLNGFVLTWQPKWTKGLFIGFSRVFYQYLSDVPANFDGYMPIIGKFFKGSLKNEDEKRRDQMLSFFFRFLLPKEQAEFYAEFGRNDHSANAQDFLLEPEHSRAYIIGFSKIFDGRKKDVKLFSEITNLQKTPTVNLRAQESWYAHYQVRHGYTNLGQVIGAGIGPGGSSQTIGLQWGEGLNRIGSSFERVVHNNDFYYNAFTPLQDWQKHWVDFSLNLNKSWYHKNIIYNARLSLIHSINYEWYYKNAENITAGVSITYLL